MTPQDFKPREELIWFNHQIIDRLQPDESFQIEDDDLVILSTGKEQRRHLAGRWSAITPTNAVCAFTVDDPTCPRCHTPP